CVVTSRNENESLSAVRDVVPREPFTTRTANQNGASGAVAATCSIQQIGEGGVGTRVAGVGDFERSGHASAPSPGEPRVVSSLRGGPPGLGKWQTLSHELPSPGRPHSHNPTRSCRMGQQESLSATSCQFAHLTAC